MPSPASALAVRLLRALACLVLAGPLVLGAARADEYPVKTIRIIVGFPPGGSNDIVARIIAPRLGEAFGQPVVVENKPGANATIGTDFVAKSPADGYTLLVASASPLVITPHTFAKIPYDTLKEFAGVGLVGVTPEALAAHPSFPARNLRELAELAKTRDVTIASSGNGGMPHLAIELLKSASRGRIVHVPFKGAGPAITDTLGGHVNAVLMDLPPLVGHIKDGRLKPLALTAESRSEFVPDLATSAEQGYASVIAVNWVGVLAPAATPKAVVDKLNAAIAKIVAMPAVREQLSKAAVSPKTMAPEQFQRFLADEFERWGKVAKESGAKSD